ncbi:MAG: PQQ-binding-like beta-propeller repeat protein, partial [Planctomycetota bacterium]
GSPVVAGGRVFVGTGNEHPRDSLVLGRVGVLMAFRASDGQFLWQDVGESARGGIDGFLLPLTSSTPYVEGEKLYYVTAECQLRCLDVDGFHDGTNDGVVQDEVNKAIGDADIIWELDIVSSLGVFPHEAPNCSVLSIGDLLLVCTSNGVDEAHTNIPAPRAPSFIAVHKDTGKVEWQVTGPSEKVLHGQWSSPSAAIVNGRTLVFFGGGDGILYALDAKTGREVWRFDGNPKDAIWRSSGDIQGKTFRNNIIACPVVHRGRVYLTMGQDPNHGSGKGAIYAIDPGGRGDVTTSRRIWSYTDMSRAMATPVIQDDLLYVADNDGVVHALDLKTGERVWAHDLYAGVWASILLADGKLFVGDEDGVVTVFRPGRKLEILAKSEVEAPIYSAPAVVDGRLYLASANRLFAISHPAAKEPAVEPASNKQPAKK